MSRISKRKFWETLKKDPEVEHSIFDRQIEDWLTGYKRFRKQEEQQLEMDKKILKEHLKAKKKNANN